MDDLIRRSVKLPLPYPRPLTAAQLHLPLPPTLPSLNPLLLLPPPPLTLPPRLHRRRHRLSLEPFVLMIVRMIKTTALDRGLLDPAPLLFPPTTFVTRTSPPRRHPTRENHPRMTLQNLFITLTGPTQNLLALVLPRGLL